MMLKNDSNRFRVSSRFALVKVVLWVVLSLMLINTGIRVDRHSFDQKGLIGVILVSAACLGLLYFVNTRKRIDYDDIRLELYIVDEKVGIEEVVPVGRIEKITLSAFGFGGPGQRGWNIVYMDDHGVRKKVRLYPIPFNNDIDSLIVDARFANPVLVVRRWTFGWNELWD